MKVLLAGDGLFSSTGGGQRFYEGQVLRNPDIQFFAFSGGVPQNRSAGSAIPRNLRFVPLFDANRQSVAGAALSVLHLDGKPRLAGKEHDIAFLMDIGASVAGMEFDVVDIPDYLPFAALLPSALRAFDVTVGRFALSMHGTLSLGLKDNWDNNSLDLEALEWFEDLLYRSVDIRYGISSRYLREWETKTALPAIVVDPGVEVSPPLAKVRKSAGVTSAAPELCFVGRQEKWKGPDLFVEFCSRLPKDLFSAFSMVGPQVSVEGHRSQDALGRLAETRGLTIDTREVNPRQMQEWYTSSPRVVMLPSRRDTFNLVALESLLSGCPTIISSECGVVDYLDEHYPGIPYVRFDPMDLMGSYDAVVDLAENFDAYQAQLAGFLAQRSRAGGELPELTVVYEQTPAFEPSVRAALEEIWVGIEQCSRGWLADATQGYGRQGVERFHTVLPDYDSPRLTDAFVERQHAHQVRFTALCREARATEYQALEGVYERSLGLLHTMSNEFNRANLFRFLAEFERARGNELLFATYMARVFRLTGRTDQSELPVVQAILRSHGLEEEAYVLGLLVEGNQETLFNYLQQRRSLDFTPADVDFLTFADRRDSESVPRVSVVVSVYNAEELLPAFLRELLRQTPAVLSDTEYIFVDSNSADRSVETLDELLEDARARGLRSLVVKTPERETIQRAWNRGIGLARGRYLTFLGVDETVRPDALAVLADLLDDNPNVDWAQGNVVVTEVNDQGSFVRDVMPYVRTFDMQEMHYLDSCYIGFVGAMYRRSVHERFGLYDDSFRGAGDTEFKNRILPHITVAAIPEMLGTYLNYPSERTTASPLVELEDIRAWYAFRTPAGVRYLFENRDPDDVARLLVHCLGYRKTYLDFTSTDVDLAVAIIDYADERLPDAHSTIDNWRTAVWFMAQVVRKADDLQSMRTFRGLEGARMLGGALEWIWNALARAREGMGGHGALLFEVTNDNRWQQHHWIWPSVAKRLSVGSRACLGDIEGRTLSEIVGMARTGLVGAATDVEIRLAPTPADAALDLWDTLDVVLVVPSLRAIDASFVTALTDESNVTLVVVELDGPGDRGVELLQPSVVRVSLADLSHPELLLLAARSIVIPANVKGGAQLLEVCVEALCAGVPVVLSEDLAASWNERLGLSGDESLLGSPTSEALLLRLVDMVVSGQLRERESARSYAIASALVASGRVHVGPDVEARLEEHPWVEFGISSAEFDEAHYLSRNPDVAHAIELGQYGSGWEHFQVFGRAEGRTFRARRDSSLSSQGG